MLAKRLLRPEEIKRRSSIASHAPFKTLLTIDWHGYYHHWLRSTRLNTDSLLDHVGISPDIRTCAGQSGDLFTAARPSIRSFQRHHKWPSSAGRACCQRLLLRQFRFTGRAEVSITASCEDYWQRAWKWNPASRHAPGSVGNMVQEVKGSKVSKKESTPFVFPWRL